MYRRSSFNKRIEPLRPTMNSGNLYYARLKTSVGILYKLGFTNLGSVSERLAYQGRGDEQLLDEVLLFSHFENAADIEAAAHEHFGYKAVFGLFSNEDQMPLCGNGQSELYAEDILKMDPAYSGLQSYNTVIKIAKRRYGENLFTPEAEDLKRQEKFHETQILLIQLFAPIIKLYKKLVFMTSTDIEKKKIGLVDELMTKAQEVRTENERLNLLPASYLDEAKVARQVRINQLNRDLKASENNRQYL